MLRATVLSLALVASGVAGGLTAATAHAQSSWDTPRQDRSAERGGPAAAQYSIADLQRALAEAGYDPGPVDGALGPSTREAVASFQHDMGLRVTGAPDNQVVRILERRGFLTAERFDLDRQRPMQGDGTAAAGADADLVADVQAALRDQGYGVDEVNGALDAQTRAAIRAFQRNQGLPASGQPTPALLALIETQSQQGRQMTDAEVIREIEIRLHNRGYDIQTIDGRIEQDTAQSIRAYQEEQGLSPTGEPSRSLLAHMDDARRPAQAEAPADHPQDIFRQLGERALQELEGR